MSVRGSTAPFGVALGVAALAGAAQLGVAYGLGILLWNQQYTAEDPAWAINLTWACWLAAVSVVGGAVAGGRLLPADPRHPGARGSRIQRFGVALVAGCGGSLTVLLVAVPARYAELPAVEPTVTAGRTAAIGVAVGVAVAAVALVARPLAWNALGAVGSLWILTLVAVGVAVRDGSNPDGLRLAVWGGPGDVTGWTFTLVPMMASAVLIGVASAVAARRIGASRLVVATCGAPGPLLVATAYLIAGPGAWGERGPQFFPYIAAPYAVLAGLVGSLLVVALDRRTAAATAEPAKPETPTADSATTPASGRHAATATPAEEPAPAPATKSIRKASTRKTTPAKAAKPTKQAKASEPAKPTGATSATPAPEPILEPPAPPEPTPDPAFGDKPGPNDWPAQLRDPESGGKRRGARRAPKR